MKRFATIILLSFILFSIISASDILETITVGDSIFIEAASDSGHICIYDSIRNRWACSMDGIWTDIASFNHDTVKGKVIEGSTYRICVIHSPDVATICSTLTITSPDNYIYHVIDSEWVKNDIRVGRSIYNYDTTETSNIGTCENPFDTLFVRAIKMKSGDSCVVLRSFDNEYVATLAGFYFDGSPLLRSYKFVVPFDSVKVVGIEYYFRVPPDSGYGVYLKHGSISKFASINSVEAGISIIDSSFSLIEEDTLEIVISDSSLATKYGGFDLTILIKGIIFGFTTGRTYYYWEDDPILGEADFLTETSSDSTDTGSGPIFVTPTWIIRFVSTYGRYPTYGDIHDTLSSIYSSNIRMWTFKDTPTINGPYKSVYINENCSDYAPMMLCYSNNDYGSHPTRFYRNDKIIAYKPIMFSAVDSTCSLVRILCAFY